MAIMSTLDFNAHLNIIQGPGWLNELGLHNNSYKPITNTV
jgi:hypothetical protein